MRRQPDSSGPVPGRSPWRTVRPRPLGRGLIMATRKTTGKAPARTAKAAPTKRGSNGRFTKAAKDVEQAVAAVKMRGQGATFRQIAERLGVSVSTAHGIVEDAYVNVLQEPAAAALALELERLDNDLLALNIAQQRITAAMRPPRHGDDQDDDEPRVMVPLAAGTTVLVRIVEAKGRISERRTRLRGLGAPQLLRLEPPQTVSRDEITALIAAGEAANAKGVKPRAARRR